MAVFFGLEKPLISNDDGKGEASNSVDIEPTLAMTEEAFDLWMVVECKSRCNQADNKIQNEKIQRKSWQNPILIKNPRQISVDNEKIQLKPGLHMGVVIGLEQVKAQTKIIEAGGHALSDSLV
ncbi:hypothetical protein Gorai_016360, partial [Gossypium raimondii]|nr:hypothetical protein [Gossypium raimondii]